MGVHKDLANRRTDILLLSSEVTHGKYYDNLWEVANTLSSEISLEGSLKTTPLKASRGGSSH